jgi:hypothetical protein
MAVFLNWILTWLTYGRGARLITGNTPLALAAKPAIPAESGNKGTPDGRQVSGHLLEISFQWRKSEGRCPTLEVR